MHHAILGAGGVGGLIGAVLAKSENPSRSCFGPIR